MQQRNPSLLLVISLLLAVSACGTSAPEPTATPIPTDTPVPTHTPIPTNTPTPTPIPLSELDLESLLLLPGDLPSGYETQQIRTRSLPQRFAGLELPGAQQLIYTDITDTKQRGRADPGVMVLLYDSLSDRDEAYQKIAAHQDLVETVSHVGERAVGETYRMELHTYKLAQVVFVRCHAVAFLYLFGPRADEHTVITYAERLDKRLEPIVCRPSDAVD